MSDDPVDDLMNELVVTGALFIFLRDLVDAGYGIEVTLTQDDDGPFNALWVRFSFLRSRYRLTVTMDPEPGEERSHEDA